MNNFETNINPYYTHFGILPLKGKPNRTALGY